jgi:Fur family ferric uptake transcriptional regulator
MSDEKFANKLRAAGLRATLGRIDLIKILNKSGRPLSVEEIVQKFNLSLDTVSLYRALNEFVEKGLAHKVAIGHSHAHYEASDSDHHHFICQKCGAIEDIKNCTLDKSIAKAIKNSKLFNHVNQHSFELYGKCLKCK